TEQRAAFIEWMTRNRGEDPTFLGKRWDRFRQLVTSRDIWDKREIRAFLLTPREEFVTRENLNRAYEWHFLNIGFGVTITGPHTVARMTNAVGGSPGAKVLETGPASGSRPAFRPTPPDGVWSIEITRPLAERPRRVYDSLIERGYTEYKAITSKNA